MSALSNLLSHLSLPRLNLPKVDVPRVNLPKFELPKLELPHINLPHVNLPKFELPKLNLPHVNLPRFELPKITLPQVNVTNPFSRDELEAIRETAATTAQPMASALAPALMRVLTVASAQLNSGEDPAKVAAEAARLIAASPEMMEAFKAAVPLLQITANSADPNLGRLARSILPLLADGQTADAVVAAAGEVAGANGAALAGAAVNGLSLGGIERAAAEVTAAGVKIFLASGSSVGVPASVLRAVGKASPLVGNAVNLLSVGHSTVGLINALRDPQATDGRRVAHAAHLALTVAGCFVPVVGAAADLAMAALGGIIDHR